MSKHIDFDQQKCNKIKEKRETVIILPMRIAFISKLLEIKSQINFRNFANMYEDFLGKSELLDKSKQFKKAANNFH